MTSSSWQQIPNPSNPLKNYTGAVQPTSFFALSSNYVAIVIAVLMVISALLLFLVPLILVSAFAAGFFETQSKVAIKKSLHEPDKDCLLSATDFTEQLKSNVNLFKT